MPKKYVFVCVQNAGRSQMAAALAKRLGGDEVEVASAGTMPGDHVHPEVVEVMRELGIDLSQQRPQEVTDDIFEGAEAIVVMGCGASGFCPAVFLPKVENWDLDDPHNQPLEKVRAIREQIRAKVTELLGRE